MSTSPTTGRTDGTDPFLDSRLAADGTFDAEAAAELADLMLIRAAVSQHAGSDVRPAASSRWRRRSLLAAAAATAAAVVVALLPARSDRVASLDASADLLPVWGAIEFEATAVAVERLGTADVDLLDATGDDDAVEWSDEYAVSGVQTDRLDQPEGTTTGDVPDWLWIAIDGDATGLPEDVL